VSKPIKVYFAAENGLFAHFGCVEHFPIRGMRDCAWRLLREGDTYFLACVDDNNNKTNFVVIKKNNEPMIFNKRGHTMIICIDCVKMAFILSDEKKLD